MHSFPTPHPIHVLDSGLHNSRIETFRRGEFIEPLDTSWTLAKSEPFDTSFVPKATAAGPLIPDGSILPRSNPSDLILVEPC